MEPRTLTELAVRVRLPEVTVCPERTVMVLPASVASAMEPPTVEVLKLTLPVLMMEALPPVLTVKLPVVVLMAVETPMLPVPEESATEEPETVPVDWVMSPAPLAEIEVVAAAPPTVPPRAMLEPLALVARVTRPVPVTLPLTVRAPAEETLIAPLPPVTEPVSMVPVPRAEVVMVKA